MGIEVHLNLVKKAESLIRTDNRFIGMALGGSWINKQLDEFSDLDIYLIMSDHAVLSIDEKKEILCQYGELLCFYNNANDDNVTVSLFKIEEQLLHVDCKWIYLSGLRKRVENPDIIFEKDGLLSKYMRDFPNEGYEQPNLELSEMRFWTWMHYIFSKIGRGEIIEACSYLCEVRIYCLGPMILYKNKMTARRLRHAEQLPTEELLELKTTFPAECRAESCFNAAMNTIALYSKTRDALASADFKTNFCAEKACLEYAAIIKAICCYRKENS
jgi:hypothetical protein